MANSAIKSEKLKTPLKEQHPLKEKKRKKKLCMRDSLQST
jgi:hypothetical protein